MAGRMTKAQLEAELAQARGEVASLKQQLARLGGHADRGEYQWADDRTALTSGQFSDRVRMDATRVQDETLLHLIAETISEVFWITDPNINRVIYVSPAYERIWGRPSADLSENPRVFIDSIHPEDRERVLSAFQLQQVGVPFDQEYRIIRPDGALRTIWDRGYPVCDESGQIVKYVGIAQDVTEHRKTEEALHAREHQMRAMLTSLDDIVFEVDEHGTYLNVWTANEANLFQPREQLIGHQLDDIFGAEMSRPFYSIIARVRESGMPEMIEYALEIGGTQRWFAARVSLILSQDAASKTFSVLVRDISEREQAEERLRQSEADLAEAQRVAKLGSWRFDVATGAVRWSQELYRIFDVEAGTFGEVYDSFLGHIHPNDRAMVLATNRQAVESGDAFTIDYRILTSQGDVKHIREVGYATKDASGAVTGLFGIAQDVTELKQAEALVSAQRDLAHIISAGLPMQEAWTCCLGIVLRAAGFDGGGIYLFDAEMHTLELITHQGLSEDFIRGVERYPIDAPNVQMLLSGRTFYFNAADIVHQEPVRREGLRSSASVPIQYQGEVIGSINVASYSRTDIPEAARVTLETLATEVGGIVVQFRTEASRRQALAALAESEKRYRLLSENSTDIIWLLDIATRRFSYFSPSVFHLRGYTPEEAMALPLEKHLTPEFYPIVRKELAERIEALARGDESARSGRIESEEVRKDGSMMPAEVVTTLLTDAEGRPVQVLGAVRDITERKHAEAALRQREEQQRLMLDHLPVGVVLTDLAGNPVYQNPTFVDLFGYTLDQMPTFAAWIEQAYPDTTYRELLVAEWNLRIGKALASDGEIEPMEAVVTCADGSKKIASVTARVLGNALFVSFIDITERKEVEALLEERVQKRTAELNAIRQHLEVTNRELEHAVRVKDEFLTSMSHELRTPLTGVLGFSEALSLGVYGPLNERQIKALSSVESSGRHLLDLINDILDIAKLDAGRLEIDAQPCSLTEICQTSLQLIRGMAQKKRQSVSFAMTPDAIAVVGDARRLKQILVNLLGNAIKFTPENGSLGLEVLGDRQAQSVYLTVWDKGIGIRPEDIARLFEPFVQVDSSLSRQQGGSGLGLSLVKRLTEMHGGTVRVESTPGEGSRFTVMLPWHPA